MSFDLNENQRLAVRHKDGPMLVVAGPGSGKTAVITHRAAYMSAKQNIPAGNILVITYSKNAAEQMKLRFKKILPNADVIFGTFHAVFFKMLRMSRPFKLEQVVKDGERREVVKKIIFELGEAPDDEALSNILNELSLVRNDLIDLRYYHSASVADEVFKNLYEKYLYYKTVSNKIDFDDMLYLCYEMFLNEPAGLEFWRKRFPYIMIDEFQDINKIQYETVKLLSAPLGNLFAVGDDDQSIYRFRGARPEFLLNFPNDFAGTKQVVLNTNYRSTDEIINYSNELISGNSIRYGKVINGVGISGKPPVFLNPSDQNEEADSIAKIIKKLAAKGHDLEEIAVIFRVNIQSRAFADAFLTANIPYRVRDEAPVIYEHDVAKDIFAYLRLSLNLEADNSAVRIPDELRIINKPFRYIGKVFLEKAKKQKISMLDCYINDPSINTAQKTRIEELHLQLNGIRNRNPYDAVKYIRLTAGYDRYIREQCEYRRQDPSGLMEVADEISEAAKKFKSIKGFLAHTEEVVSASKENADPNEKRCTLTTFHSAKGLEYDTVFIAGAVEGLIPHERSKAEAEIEEERRLMYVGITRARNNLYISAPKTRYDKKIEISRFICHETEEKTAKK